ncbi:toll-like receptor 2 isoform X2 [Petromyzon marinus]|uniref:toll-like receptor 2 isoform X2 n=1 Tax=Petromyzon marinus TaxID=7757 RepID=UPI003F72619D
MAWIVRCCAVTSVNHHRPGAAGTMLPSFWIVPMATFLLCSLLPIAGWATPDRDREPLGLALGSAEAAAGTVLTLPVQPTGGSVLRSTGGSATGSAGRSPAASAATASSSVSLVESLAGSLDESRVASTAWSSARSPAGSPATPPWESRTDESPARSPAGSPAGSTAGSSFGSSAGSSAGPSAGSSTGSEKAAENCKLTGSHADCSGRRLTRVPQGLPANISSLDLSRNELAELGELAFRRYPLLRQLKLQFNVMARMHDRAFLGCSALEELDLFNNSLTVVPDAQLGPLLGSLRMLNVSNNLYRRVELGTTFSRLTSLRHLWLGGELVSDVRAADLAALRSLDLTIFSLKTGQGFRSYEPGALASLAGSAKPAVTLDCDLDAAPTAVTPMLADLAATGVHSLRFRRLFATNYYTGADDLFAPLPRLSRLRNLEFFRGKFNENLHYLILKHLQRSAVEALALTAVDFAYSAVTERPRVPVGKLPLRTLAFRDITNPEVLLYNGNFNWYGSLDTLTINNVNFNVVPCPAWAAMHRVVTADISNNRLTDSALLNVGCDYRGTVPLLRSLLLADNALTRLATVAQLAREWGALRNVSLARNSIGGAVERCNWSQPIEWLDLSYNRAAGDVYDCLPLTLRHLDLSFSDVDRLDLGYFARADRLECLLLSGNNIKFIPSGWRAPVLRFLAIDRNSFGVIDRGTFELMVLLRSLRADNNPFQCTCDLWGFLSEVRALDSPVRLEGWPNNYTCYHPAQLLGTQLERFRPGSLECDVRLVVLVSAVVTAALAVACLALCRRFDVPWYVRALWNLLRSKRRKLTRGGGRQFAPGGRDYRFHAFISYSHEDAAWVRENLMPQLESARPPLRVCVHERDFTPGMWIIDNIIDSIELSRKVIFVLSSAFVDSEWCNYELYFAHQRPAHDAMEDLVLLLKEPIRPESLPSRFCKLRKLLSKKTYLEWPAEATKQSFFWAQLRAILRYEDGLLLEDVGTEGLKVEEAGDKSHPF